MERAGPSGVSLLSLRVLLNVLITALVIPHAVALAQPAAGAEWTTPAGTVQGTRFSSLEQINAGNVHRLQEEFKFSTGVIAGHEGQPLVVKGLMYVVTPFPNKLYALDLGRGGSVRWVFDPRPDPFAQDKACCDIVNRGAAFHPRNAERSSSVDKIIFTVLDNTTVAVNARTGVEVWRTKLGDPAKGQTMTMAPLVIGDKVFVGNSGGEFGVRGFIAALDAESGRLAWKKFSTGPDADVGIVPATTPPYAKDKGVDQGVTSWPGTLWQQGGSTVWLWLTYDPELNLLFHGTANPGVWNPDMRPGDNKWSTTMFARDPSDGTVRYMYQITPHDAWDYDGTNENIVADVGGRKLVVRFDRNGFAYTHDRATGRIFNANPYVKVNWAAAIDFAGTGMPIEDPLKRTHEGVTTLDICPALVGGKDQQPAAFSPRTELFYVPVSTLCMNYHPLKAIYMAGTPFMGAAVGMHPADHPEPERIEQRGFGPPVAHPVLCGRPGVTCGEFIAWDAATGTKRWSIKERFPVWSGALATAGDLVFYGTLDRWFKAVDARSGDVVFQTQLPAGIIGNPMTFLGPDGQQRIAIWSGPGGALAGLIPHDFARDDPNLMNLLREFTGPGHFLHVFKIN